MQLSEIESETPFVTSTSEEPRHDTGTDLVLKNGRMVDQATGEIMPVGGRVRFAEQHLEIPDDLTYEEWTLLGDTLQELYENLPWYIADWWNFGERKYGELSAQAIKQVTGLERHTVYNYAWVGRRWPPEERQFEVPFGHYYDLAKMRYDYPERAKALLAEAEEQEWNRETFRENAKALRKALPKGTTESELAAPRLEPAHHCPTCSCIVDWSLPDPEGAEKS